MLQGLGKQPVVAIEFKDMGFSDRPRASLTNSDDVGGNRDPPSETIVAVRRGRHEKFRLHKRVPATLVDERTAHPPGGEAWVRGIGNADDQSTGVSGDVLPETRHDLGGCSSVLGNKA